MLLLGLGNFGKYSKIDYKHWNKANISPKPETLLKRCVSPINKSEFSNNLFFEMAVLFVIPNIMGIEIRWPLLR
jgi:hypothetical protein